MSARAAFLGLEFDLIELPGLCAWIAGRDAASPFAYVVTPNVDHMVRLADADDPVRAAYRAADVIICDSRVLARAARFAGVALTVAPGSDVVAALFERVFGADDRICVVGARAGDVARLRARYPALDIVHIDPPHGLRDDAPARAAAAAAAAAAGARVTLLAVGSPQQELIAHHMAQSGNARGTALCIGASVDFIVGAQRRAPLVVQRAGMEWAWRLASDPRRLARRYLVDGPRIFPMIWRWRREQRRRSR